ncbi:hypothetical protein [Streptomyces sp. NRRL S-448]
MGDIAKIETEDDRRDCLRIATFDNFRIHSKFNVPAPHRERAATAAPPH